MTAILREHFWAVWWFAVFTVYILGRVIIAVFYLVMKAIQK